MKNKLIASLLCGLLVIGVLPVGVSAEWRQNSDNSWSWNENGVDTYYGWKLINGGWYYFDDQKMQTGWINSGSYYYLGNDGVMKTGWVNDGGKNYYLKSDGSLATDTVIDGCYVDSKGVAVPKENQKVILDNKYVKITYLGVDRTDPYSKKIEVEVENKSDQDLRLLADDISVDNYVQYCVFSPSILAGKKALDYMTFNDVKTNFECVDGKFKILSDNYDILEEDKFSIKF